MVMPSATRPSREMAAAMPNFAASASVWKVTASGATMSTGRPVCRRTFSAHVSCMGDFPRPQSAKMPARPLRAAQVTRSDWNGNSPSAIHTGAKPCSPPMPALRARSSS
jgi:hypothetical protein